MTAGRYHDPPEEHHDHLQKQIREVLARESSADCPQRVFASVHPHGSPPLYWKDNSATLKYYDSLSRWASSVLPHLLSTIPPVTRYTDLFALQAGTLSELSRELVYWHRVTTVSNIPYDKRESGSGPADAIRFS